MCLKDRFNEIEQALFSRPTPQIGETWEVEINGVLINSPAKLVSHGDTIVLEYPTDVYFPPVYIAGYYNKLNVKFIRKVKDGA